MTNKIILHRVCRLFFVLGLLSIFDSCKKATVEAPPDLIILQTGRLRGNLFPTDIQHGGSLQHYPYIAGYVKQVREEAAKTGTPVLLVDLGDSFTGSFASSVTNSANVATFFNTLQYDAVMLGNLDADVPPAALKSLKMPVLCPFQDEEGKPAMPGTNFTTSFKKGNYGVQLLANFYGSSHPEEFPERFPSTFGPAVQVRPFRDYQSIPKYAEGSSPLRIFEWMKFENENATPPALLADLKKLGVDLVLAHRIYGREKMDAWTGHSMFRWDPPVSVNILRNNRGFALARADLKREGGKWKLMKQTILPMISNTAPADAQIQKEMQRYAKNISEADARVATLKEGLSQDKILELYLTALSSVPETSAALYSPEAIRSGWNKGDLHVGDIFSTLPWITSLVQVDLTDAEFTSLREMKSFQVLRKETPPASGRWRITTSKFFARTIVQRLKLNEDRIFSVTSMPEYDFFAKYLKSQIVATEMPVGWILEKP